MGTRLIDEAEDFEVFHLGELVGRFMVQSVDPYVFDFEKEWVEFMEENPTKTVVDFLQYNVHKGIIKPYIPNHTVVVDYFDKVEVKSNVK